MSHKDVNALATELLSEIKTKFENDELSIDVINDYLKVSNSTYFQKKRINEVTNFEEMIHEFTFNNTTSKFYFIDLKIALLNYLNDDQIMELIWQENFGRFKFTIII